MSTPPKKVSALMRRADRVTEPAQGSPDATFGHVAFAGDAAEVVKKMRAGTPARVISEMAARLGLSQSKLVDMLKFPKSAIKARISDDALLSHAEQDRVYRVAKVWARALGVLEDHQAAQRWIARQNRSLGGEAPLSLLDTEAGYELVLDTLGRIESGTLA